MPKKRMGKSIAEVTTKTAPAKERAVPTLTTEERLEKLERQNRRFKLAGICGLLLVAALVGFAATKGTPEVVDAREFRLVDEGGALRASWQCNKAETSFVMSYPGAPGTWMHSSVRIVCNDEGFSALVLGGKNGIQAWAKDKEGAVLRFTDITWYPEEELDTAPVLCRSSPRALIDLSKDGPSLVLYDEDNASRAVVGCTTLVMPETDIQTKRPESSVVLFDKKGQVIWAVP